MKTGFVRHGFLATRVLGFLLGAFMIAGAVMYNDTVSDIRDRLPPEKLFLHILGYSIVSLPLIVPWRFVRWPALWWPLFIILCFDVAAMLYKGVVDAIWAFRYGESTQQLMFPLLSLLRKCHPCFFLSFLRKQESSEVKGFWTPASAGVTAFL